MHFSCLFSTLVAGNKSWYAKVIVVEKTNIFKSPSKTFQSFIFADEEKNTIQAVVYDDDTTKLNSMLELYKGYYIGNAVVSNLVEPRYQRGSIPLQITLNRGSYIKKIRDLGHLSVGGCYPLARFSEFDKYMDVDNERFYVLCIVVQALTKKTITTSSRTTTVQEFVIVNQECRPMILSVWDDQMLDECTELMKVSHRYPIIMLARPKVSNFHGICLYTKGSTLIVFDPPIPETAALKTWAKENMDYIQKVIDKKLYQRTNQILTKPSPEQIQQILQLLSSNEGNKNYWIKARAKVGNITDQLIQPCCSECGKKASGLMDMPFECLYCDAKEQLPKPRIKLFLELTDDTGSIIAYVDDKYAENLIGVTAEEIYAQDKAGQCLDIDKVNQKLQDIGTYFQVRTFATTQRGDQNVGYILSAHIQPRQEESSSSTGNDDVKDSSSAMKRTFAHPSDDGYQKKKRQ